MRTNPNARSAANAYHARYLEADFQRDLLAEADKFGWTAFHSVDPRRDSISGFPDLVLRHIASGRVIFAELKKMGGRLSADQREWLTGLALNPANEVALWFPSDWPEIIAVLRGRRAELRLR
jgi:VRR-NUC domain